MGIEREERAVPGVVFTTAQLVWRDEESGEVLEIEVVGAAPWVQELVEQGFVPTEGAGSRLQRYRCRIEIAPDPG
jgi:hypothetical protein